MEKAGNGSVRIMGDSCISCCLTTGWGIGPVRARAWFLIEPPQYDSRRIHPDLPAPGAGGSSLARHRPSGVAAGPRPAAHPARHDGLLLRRLPSVRRVVRACPRVPVRRRETISLAGPARRDCRLSRGPSRRCRSRRTCGPSHRSHRTRVPRAHRDVFGPSAFSRRRCVR